MIEPFVGGLLALACVWAFSAIMCAAAGMWPAFVPVTALESMAIVVICLFAALLRTLLFTIPRLLSAARKRRLEGIARAERAAKVAADRKRYALNEGPHR